jgi:hypothetical protein
MDATQANPTRHTMENISVNLSTGEIAYPSPEGFELDMERVYRSAERFVAHCSMEMAIKHAIHEQLSAYRGMASLRAMCR